MPSAEEKGEDATNYDYNALRGDAPPSTLSEAFNFDAIEDDIKQLIQKAILRSLDGRGFSPGQIPKLSLIHI